MNMIVKKKAERKNLILWEKENGLKAKDVANALGITEQTYCNIKKGTTTPSIELAYKFIEAFPDADVLELMKLKKGR